MALIIKKAYSGEFKYFLSVIRLAILNKRSFLIFSKKKFNYLPILQQLRLSGFIESYENRGQLMVIVLKQTYWKAHQWPLHALVSIEEVQLNKYKTSTVKQFVKFQKRQGEAVQSFISTDRGIFTGLKALQTRTGGIPLFKIY